MYIFTDVWYKVCMENADWLFGRVLEEKKWMHSSAEQVKPRSA